MQLPNEIRSYINGMELAKDNIGQSNAKVYSFRDSKQELYLKIEKKNEEFNREQAVMKWLQNKLPVPNIINISHSGEIDYLLMSKVHGTMSCEQVKLLNPEETIKALANGLMKFHSINIKECPFDSRLQVKLSIAKKRIDNNKVDMDDWEEDNNFKSPEELYKYLIHNQPKEELVFTHGDYCFPNVFIQGDEATGFIDLGRSGIADRWQDIALCVRSIRHNFRNKDYTHLLFEYLDIEPDYEKIKYYILLDELF